VRAVREAVDLSNNFGFMFGRTRSPASYPVGLSSSSHVFHYPAASVQVNQNIAKGIC
jgi:hypothetical protein